MNIYSGPRSKEKNSLIKFLKKKGLETEKAKEVLELSLNKYKNTYINGDCNEKFVVDCATASSNFGKFLEIITEDTGIKFKNNPNKKNMKSTIQKNFGNDMKDFLTELRDLLKKYNAEIQLEDEGEGRSSWIEISIRDHTDSIKLPDTTQWEEVNNLIANVIKQNQ